MRELKPLPEFINGFKIIKDLGMTDRGIGKKRIRRAIISCKICSFNFSIIVREIQYQKSCSGCLKNLDIDPLIKKRLFGVHAGMKDRCNNPKNKDFINYGGRGIKVCDEWFMSYHFCIWSIANGYMHGLTIDRIDNNKGYSSDNCRWVTPQVNSQNVRHSILNPALVRLIKDDLKTMSGIDVAIKYGFTKQQISTIKTGKCWSNV